VKQQFAKTMRNVCDIKKWRVRQRQQRTAFATEITEDTENGNGANFVTATITATATATATATTTARSQRRQQPAATASGNGVNLDRFYDTVYFVLSKVSLHIPLS